MTSIILNQEKNLYYLSYIPAPNFDGDLGIGGGHVTMKFHTEYERSQFIGFTKQLEECNRIIANLHSELQFIKTIKGANQNLREVRKKKKEE